MPEECLQIENLYCLRYLWKDLNENQQGNLRKYLKEYFSLYNQCYKDNKYFHNEPRCALCICPEGYGGTNPRIVSIQDPRKNKKGVVCVKFSERHGDSYSAKLNEAQDAYRAFREVTFATEEKLNEYERKHLNSKLRPLIYAGFYRVVFEQSKDIYKINNQNREFSDPNGKNNIHKEFWKLYTKLENELYDNSLSVGVKVSKCKYFLNHFRNKYGYNWEYLLTDNAKDKVEKIKEVK